MVFLINWVLIPALILVTIVTLVRLFYPGFFRRFFVPAFEGSYDPSTDTVQPPALLTVQESMPSLAIDPATSEYRIDFGDGRSLEHGLVRLHVKGRWFSSRPTADETLLEYTGQDTCMTETRLGKANTITLHWRVPGTNLTLDTAFHRYPGSAYICFEARVPVGIEGLDCGTIGEPTISFPCFENASPNKRVLCYKNQAFSPAQRDFTFTTSPACFFDDDRNAFIISALDHFITHGVQKIGLPGSTRIAFGPNGILMKVPAGHVSSSLVVFGRGINSTFLRWGELLRKHHDSPAKDRYGDIITSNIGYFTDNGGYYYYRPINGRYDTTLIAIKEYADKEQLAFAYYHLDSWWYPKIVKSLKRALINFFHIRLGGGIFGGALEWTPDPYYFPKEMTLATLSKQLGGKPFTAHHRWYSAESQLKDKFKFIIEDGWAVSLDPAYWEFIMAYAKESNIALYEQDWMVSHENHFRAFKTELGFGETWLKEMAIAAEKFKLTIQYCMAPPAMWMTAVKYPSVTNVRGSRDYHPEWPHVLNMAIFTQSAILARALNLWSFKDVFFTSKGEERRPELMAILSALSAGPVAPGDKIGHVDKELVRKCCRPDGLLLKPDRALTAADIMFTKHAKYYLCTTENTHGNLTWHYVLAANLWPNRVQDKGYTLGELDIYGDRIEFDFSTRMARRVHHKERIELSMKHEQHSLRVYAPVLDNGWAVIGDAGRFAMMNDKTFSGIKALENGMEMIVTSIAGDRVDVVIYCPKAPASVKVDGNIIPASECRFDAANCLLHVAMRFSSDQSMRLAVTD